MLDQYFKYPGVLRRLRSGALGGEMDRDVYKRQVSRGLIFAWRKEARVDGFAIPAVPRLIPVQLAASPPLPSSVLPAPLAQTPLPPVRSAGRKAGMIEIDLGDGKRVRVDANVDADALGRVLDVLGRK